MMRGNILRNRGLALFLFLLGISGVQGLLLAPSQIVAADMIAGTIGHCIGFSSVYPVNNLLSRAGSERGVGPLRAVSEAVGAQGLRAIPSAYDGIDKHLPLQGAVKAVTIWSFTEFGRILMNFGVPYGLLGKMAGMGLAAAATGLLAGVLTHPWLTVLSSKEADEEMQEVLPIKKALSSFRDQAAVQFTILKETVGYSFFLFSHTVLCWMFPVSVMTWWGTAIAGATAGVICTFSIFPFGKIAHLLFPNKDQKEGTMEEVPAKAAGVWDGLKNVARNKGISSLFEGIGHHIPQALVHNVVGFLTYFALVPSVRSLIGGWMWLI